MSLGKLVSNENDTRVRLNTPTLSRRLTVNLNVYMCVGGGIFLGPKIEQIDLF